MRYYKYKPEMLVNVFKTWLIKQIISATSVQTLTPNFVQCRSYALNRILKAKVDISLG